MENFISLLYLALDTPPLHVDEIFVTKCNLGKSLQKKKHIDMILIDVPT